MGYCYLIHLDTPLSENHTARHYLGYCRHVPSRMEAHRTGRGARFMQVVRERGIAWSIATRTAYGRLLRPISEADAEQEPAADRLFIEPAGPFPRITLQTTVSYQG